MDVKVLYELQLVDTAIDQAKVALEKLVERPRHQQAIDELVKVRAQLHVLSREQQIMEIELADIENKTKVIAKHIVKLEGQLRTVIVAREAEALQHEIKTLADQREELDDRGLSLLDSSALSDGEVARLDVLESQAVESELLARTNLATSVQVKTDELNTFLARRILMAQLIVEADLKEYERLRRNYAGIAVTSIQHGVCGGCHMDISVSELDAIKRLPADEVAECPDCNRLFVR